MRKGEGNVIDIEKDPYNCVRRVVFHGRYLPAGIIGRHGTYLEETT